MSDHAAGSGLHERLRDAWGSKCTLGSASEILAKSEHFSASTCTGFVFVHGVRCISRHSSPAVGPTRPLLRIYTETTVLGPDLGSDLARVLTQKQG